MARYEPEKYWEERLSKDFSLGGVGFLGLGVGYNKWFYKARIRALSKLLKEKAISPSGKRILDIGVGTGFYIDYWKKLGARSIVGLDITEKSVSELEKKYPEYKFVSTNICDKQLESAILDEKFDIITAFDVLFHIVEEDEFEQAIENIKCLSHHETKIIISDSFLKEPRPVGFHENDTTMDRYKEALDKVGLRPLITIPVFYFMSNPIDKDALSSRSLRILVSLAWIIANDSLRLRKRLGSLAEPIGYLIGLILYTVDGVILKYAKIGPSTKIMLVQVRWLWK